MTVIYWDNDPPSRCDICKRFIQEQFISGATLYGWRAIMCPVCHQRHGRGLGPARGQLYERQASGRWLKIDG